MEHMSTHSQGVERLRADGYVENFAIDEDGKISNTSHGFDVETIAIDENLRFEGMSNPDDESMLLAVTGPNGIKGTLSLPYGPDASGAQADTIRHLMSHRPGI